MTYNTEEPKVYFIHDESENPYYVEKVGPLCFTAKQANSSVMLKKYGDPTEISLEMSRDSNTWTPYTFGNTITLANVGDNVYMRNTSETPTDFNTTSSSSYDYNFVMTGKVAASGSIDSLRCKDETKVTSEKNYCYKYLFLGCSSLMTAPELPATTLANSCYANMFSGCSSLTEAPELPATTLADSCYYSMFQGCTSLTTGPAELPATTLADSCYSWMFSGCSSLTEAPELPATTLADSCYKYMFRGCISLTTAPSELPATTLAKDCCDCMFEGCSSLTTAPELLATTLAKDCYQYMFYNCTSLTTAPELPATTLADNCYYSMFYGCTSLTEAPELPATTLTTNCYSNMFNGCANLNYVKCLATTSISTTNCNEWLKNVSSTGIFEKNQSTPISSWVRGTSGIPYNWIYEGIVIDDLSTIDKSSKQYELPYKVVGATGIPTISTYDEWITASIDTEKLTINLTALTDKEYRKGNITLTIGDFNKIINIFQGNDALCFTAEEANSTVQLKKFDSPTVVDLEYSTDGETWSPYTIGNTITLANVGDKVYMRNTSDTPTGFSTASLNVFIMQYEYKYYNFVMTGKIASSGSVDSLRCKQAQMVTSETDFCYYKLFSGCTSLTKAPDLPSSTLANSCYSSMFEGCTSLNYVKCLATTGINTTACNGWLNNTSSTGTFVKKSGTTWPTGASGIPSGWDVEEV